MILEFLENGGMSTILIALLDHPEGVQRVFYRKTLGLGSRAARRDHEVLFDLELIENIPSQDKLLFALTPKGKKVAQLLLDIKKIMKNQ